MNKKTKYNYYLSEFQLYFTSCFFIRLIVFLHIFHIIHAFHFLGFVQITVCQILLFLWKKKRQKKLTIYSPRIFPGDSLKESTCTLPADSTHNVISTDALVALWGMISLPKILHKLSHTPGAHSQLLFRSKYSGVYSKWQQE